MTQKWIDISELELGMFIVKLGGAWMDHPFWKSRFLLANEDDLRLLQNAGLNRVCIDLTKGGDAGANPRPAAAPVETAKPAAETPAAPALIGARGDNESNAVPIKEELRRAARICSRSKEAVTAFKSFFERKKG